MEVEKLSHSMGSMVNIQRIENEHQADNDRSVVVAMGIIIKRRQQRQHPINRHSHRKVHRNR